MVRTLVDIKKELYEKLVELSVKRYGHTRAISKVLNDLLEEILQKKKGWKVEVTVKLDKNVDLSPEKVKKLSLESWIE